MGIITIDYQTISLIAVLMFALVGFMRGWLKEAVTTVLLVLLVAVVFKPELVTPLLVVANQIVKLLKAVWINLPGGPKPAAGAQAGLKDIFTPENPYNFLLWTLLFLIGLSYLGSKVAFKDEGLSPLSRILGGVLGAFNGFIAVSLFREFLARYFQGLTMEQRAAMASLQAGAPPPQGISVAIQNVPQQPFLQSVAPWVIILMAAILGLVVLSRIFKWQLK